VGTPDVQTIVNAEISGGRLDLTGGTGGSVQSYIRYDGSDGNFDGDTGQHITVRVLWSPNYNSIPSGHVYHIFRSSLSITGRDLFIQHYDDSGTERLRAYCTNSSATVIGNVNVDFEGNGVDYSAGDIFEIEYTMDSFGTDFASLFVDGTRIGQSLAVIAGWLDNNTGRYIQLGGAGGTTGINQANHYCYGAAIFNPALRASGDTSYVATGLPGEGTVTETITPVGGAVYAAGDIVRFVSMDGRVKFTHFDTPFTNRFKMATGQDWEPVAVGEWIECERTASGTWEEVRRSTNVTTLTADGSVSTTDATATTVQTFATTTDKSYAFSGLVVGRQTNGAGETGTYRVEGWVKNVADTVTEAITATVINEDVAGWDVTMIVNGTNVELQVTGAVGDDVDWSSNVTFLEA
jgi:hypothetical protein